MNDIYKVINMLGLPDEAAKSGLGAQGIAKFVEMLQFIGEDTLYKYPIVWRYVSKYGTEPALRSIIRKNHGIPAGVMSNATSKELLKAIEDFQLSGLSVNNMNVWADYESMLSNEISKNDFVNKWVKNAVIRGDDLRKCPFGLPVPSACKSAGDSVGRMAPIGEGKNSEKLAKANRIIYAYYKKCTECPYADRVLESHDKVDCDFGDTGEGQKSTPFVGSPLFPHTFHGIGLDGLYGYPLGFYADNNESRNLFFGLFSLLGYSSIEEIVKLGNKYNKCDEEDKADIVNNLLKKLQSLKEEYKETFDKIEKHLAEYREEYEDKRADSGLLWELAQKWYGRRQVSR
jgi:hypothetical protein